MKTNNFGPDAFMQLSFQFAAATHYGYHVNHYEAASMARFYKGRTETFRPLTKESQTAYNYLMKYTALTVSAKHLAKNFFGQNFFTLKCS